MSSLQNKPTGIRHNRRNLLLLFFSNLFFNIFNFNPYEFFSGASKNKNNPFFSFLFGKDVFLSFCMNMAITRFKVSKFIL